MARISDNNLTQAGLEQNQPVYLIKIEFEDTTTYTTNSAYPLVFGGNTYNAAGHLLKVTPVKETLNLVVSSFTASLSGVDSTYLGIILGEDYIDRPIKVYVGFLGNYVPSSQTWTDEPFLLMEGRMDGPTIKEDIKRGESVVSIKGTNAWVDFKRKTGRYTNSTSQQAHFPGDLGFEFATEIQSDIKWGR